MTKNLNLPTATWQDNSGMPEKTGLVDVNGYPIGQPYRSGQLEIVNGQRLAVWSWGVEFPFTTPSGTWTSVNLPFNNIISGFLLNAYVWSIEAFSGATITNLPSGATPIPQAAFNNAFITLQDNTSKTFWQNKSLRSLQTINDTASAAGNNIVSGMVGQRVNWQNSNIVIYGTTGLSASTKYSIFMELNFSIASNWQIDGQGLAQQAGVS